jgi:ribokinase
MQFAVVGHVEWVDFLRVSHVPRAGEIVQAEEAWAEAAGGGAVAAVQLAKLAGGAIFFTALGNDDLGERSAAQLAGQGIELEAGRRDRPQRRAVAFLDSQGERTITTLGPRLVASGKDDLRWDRMPEIAGVYLTGCDAAALHAARRARILVATPRARGALAGSGVTLDVLVRSGQDPGERAGAEQLGIEARMVVTTHGAQGGTYVAEDGASGTFKAAPLPGPIADAYGAGDSFAAALTFALGAGMDIEAALEVAARCGAGVLTASGPYRGQPTAADLGLGVPSGS